MCMKRKVIALLVICVMVLSGCGKTTPEEKSEETVQDIQQKEIADDFEELMEGTRELYEKVAENKLLDSLEFQKQVIGYLGQKGYAAVDMKDQVDMVHSEQVETYCEKAKRGESADVVIYSVIEQGGVVRYELHTDGDDMDAIVSTVRWTDNKPCMIYYHKFKVHSWKYTEKGYFFIEEYHPPGFDGPPGEKGFRDAKVLAKGFITVFDLSDPILAAFKVKGLASDGQIYPGETGTLTPYAYKRQSGEEVAVASWDFATFDGENNPFTLSGKDSNKFQGKDIALTYTDAARAKTFRVIATNTNPIEL